MPILIASPSDVALERERFVRVVAQFNVEWSEFLGLKLEIVRWETHAIPGIGKDAQSVVNEGLGENYDIFVGVMWARFGTPTKEAGSGTEEEFNRAYRRWQADPNSVRVLFYFKDTPIKPSEMDLDQLSKVAQFRKKLERRGVLYRWFANELEFDELVRLHLSQVVQIAIKHRKLTEETKHVGAVEHEAESIEQRSLVKVMDASLKILASLQSVSGHLTHISDVFRQGKVAIDAANASGDFPEIVRVATDVADELELLTDEFHHKAPLFGHATQELFQSYSSLIVTSAKSNMDPKHIVPWTEFDALRGALNVMHGRAVDFSKTMAAMPAVVPKLTQSRDMLLLGLQQFLGQVESAIRLTDEFKRRSAIQVIDERRIRRRLFAQVGVFDALIG